MMERANMGMSMVVAPAYLLHLKISQFFPAFTFGTAEYVFQAVLLVVLSIVMGRAKKGYLFSFVTAVLYGLVLDLAMTLIGMVPGSGPVFRLFFYLAGMVVCSAGVALLFHTYIAPEAYELFVKEIAGKYGFRIDRVKTVYDCCSCAVGIALSFAFFGWGHFEGVKMGTIFCALINGWMIGRISSWLESVFIFRDGLPFRPIFEE
jgi:uncharacterized membrane protein YczE